MKNAFITLTLLWISLSKICAQQSAMGPIPGKVIDTKTAVRAIMTQLPMAPPETVGDIYLNNYWATADITLSDKKTKLAGYAVKLNLQTNQLEIQYNDQVKILPGPRVHKFILWKPDGSKEMYINGSNYQLNAVPIGGFFRIVDSGTWTRLVKVEIRVIESTYNQALNVGARDNQLVKDETTYLCKGNTLYELELPVKKFCKQFIGRESQVNNFIKENKISLKKVDDVAILLTFLNEHI